MAESNACPSATPDINWHMDETSWNGTSNEVVDSSGNNNAGTALHGATTKQTNPAISGTPGTCGYGQFDGSDDYIESSSIYDVLKGTASLSFWIRTTQTGNNSAWNSPGITGVEQSGGSDDIFWGWLDASGHIGLAPRGDTASKSTIAINDNIFHHIVLSRNATTGEYNIYIDGVLNKSGTSYTGIIYLPFTTIGRIADTAGTHEYFQGDLDEVQVFSSVLTQSQVLTVMNETHVCPVEPDTAAVSFNCVENGSNAVSGKLFTKTTAQSFSFDIVALQNSSTIETSFASGTDHTVTVELVDSSTSGSCSTYSVLSPAVSQSLIFTSTDSGEKASVSMNSSTAYSSVACRVTDSTDSPSIVGCSTDNFSIRPTDFTLTSNLTYTDPFSTPIAKAGDYFTLTATASASTGYTGTPLIDTSKLQAHSGAIQTGTLSGTFNAAVSGVASGTSFVYTEVGALRFAAEGIYDDTFTSIDPSTECTDDFSNTEVSNKVGCKFGNTAASSYFGRFTPDYFDVSLNTPAFAPACSSFTYFGQPFQYATNPVATITAKNASGTTTQNYTGSDFWKISSASLAPTYTEASYALNVLEAGVPTVTDSGNGTGLLTYADTSSNILALTKGALSAPYDAEIALSFSLTDTDSITVANVGGSAQTNPVKFGAASSGNGISFSSSNKTQRWGRVVLSNAHGSELTPLSIPLTTEYYNGTSFIQNTNDSCTNFTLENNFSISDTADFDCSFTTQSTPVAVGLGSVKANLSNTTVTSGTTELTISNNTILTNGPGAGNTGYIEITSNLFNLSWLLYDWDGDSTHDNCPSARVTFGIYKGNNKIIYFREVY